MRVVAGEMGGRALRAPAGRGTRPTSDRVREAVFSMLESLGALTGARVWDLFAGSGALGIEALSRGAAHATFVDHHRTALACVRANLADLGYGPERASVVAAEVLVWLRRGDQDRSAPDRSAPAVPGLVALADPPYAWSGWPELLVRLAGRAALVVAETGTDLEVPTGWDVLRVRRYGGSVVSIVRPDGSRPVLAGPRGGG